MARIHRNYSNDYPSVTQVLGELRKIGLERWYMANTPQFIAKAMSDGKKAGTDTHAAIEHYILTGQLIVETEYVEEVTNALRSFAKFREDYPKIKLVISEIQMTSQVHKFNGTMDCVGSIDDIPVIVDWKTSNAKDKDKPDIYDEYITQVSAYRHLYYEHTGCKTPIHRAIVVALAKDKVAYNKRNIGEQELKENFWEVFLPALRICHYKRKEKQYERV